MGIKGLCIKDIKAQLPIIQGGMGVGISGWRLASAVANAGGIGLISAAQSGYKEDDFIKQPLKANLRGLQKEIQKAKANTQGIIGVNIMVAMRHYADLVKVAVEEKVDLIVSGAGLPMDLPKLVEGSTTKIAPIVSSLRAAKLIIRKWGKSYERLPDAIVVEGPEAGGHLGFSREELVDHTAPTIYELVKELKTYLIEAKLDIPIIAAGGIFDGEDIGKALEAGADGVQMATRFVATYECDASQAYKEAYVAAKAEDILIMQSPVGMPGRALMTPMLDKVQQGERIPISRCYACVHKCDFKTTPFCITEALTNAVQGDLDNSLLFVGSRVSDIHEIVSVKELMETLTRELLDYQTHKHVTAGNDIE